MRTCFSLSFLARLIQRGSTKFSAHYRSTDFNSYFPFVCIFTLSTLNALKFVRCEDSVSIYIKYPYINKVMPYLELIETCYYQKIAILISIHIYKEFLKNSDY